MLLKNSIGFLSLILLFIPMTITAESAPLQSRLGYSPDAKLLIIHADDFGMCHSENQATIDALSNGIVTSASVMIPTPWITEAALFANENPTADIGIHFTLTSEWKRYKWGPILSLESVPTLATPHGYFPDNVADFSAVASLEEVEAELRAQIALVQKMGIDITHFDAHMRAAVSRPDLLRLYIELGREFKVPVMLDGPHFLEHYGVEKTEFVSENDVLIDGILDARPHHFDSGMEAYYQKLLSSLEPGVYCLIVHLAQEGDEIRAVTEGQTYWGAEWRQADYDFVMSENAKALLEKNHIQPITWREIRDKLLR